MGPKSCGLSHERRDWRTFPSPSIQCRNCGGGDRGCRHLSSLRGISPSYIVLSPVWCSKPMTGVLLAPCHDEFRGPGSNYVRQIDEFITSTFSQNMKNSPEGRRFRFLPVGGRRPRIEPASSRKVSSFKSQQIKVVRAGAAPGSVKPDPCLGRHLDQI
ncbi:uncharacterized protein TNCV_4028071 [Trichonephila clavipes]|nr:uncharacterized protein TNCV_4028071 [Trichonephila clavipes]